MKIKYMFLYFLYYFNKIIEKEYIIIYNFSEVYIYYEKD